MKQSTELRFDIAGMTCASCVARVEKALRAVPGVREASVNLATERAEVKGDALDADALAAAVERAGYAARRHDAGAGAATGGGKERGAWPAWAAPAAAAALSLPLLLPMLAQPFGSDLMLS